MQKSISGFSKMLLSWFIVLLITSSAFAQVQQVVSIDKLKKQIQLTLDQYHIPGAGIVLITNDSVLWQGGVGYMQVHSKIPVTENTLFRVGSVSKSFTAIAVMQLVKAGKLSLDDELQKLAPEIQITNPWHQTHPIKVVHLLEHTAGLDDVYPAFLYKADKYPQATLKELISFSPHSLSCRWPPNERYSYSNMGYIIAGYLVEKISKMPFDAYLRHNIFLPLNMPLSTYQYGRHLKTGLSNGHQIRKGAPVAVPLREVCVDPSGSLITNPKEFSSYLLSLLNNGKGIVDSTQLRRIEHPVSTLAAQKGLPIGYGLGNIYQLAYPVLFHGHKGAIYGFNASYGYSAQNKLAFAVFLNAESIACLYALDKVIKDFLTAGFPVKKAPSSKKLSSSAIDAVSGLYTSQTPRFGLLAFIDYLSGSYTVSEEKGLLQLQPFFGKASTLIAINDSIFAEENMAAPSLLFTQHQGSWVMLHSGQYFKKSSAWLHYLLVAAIVTSVIITLVSSLIVLFNILFRFSTIKKGGFLNKWVLTMATVCLIAGFSLLASAPDLFAIGKFSFYSFSYFIGSSGFAFFTLLSTGLMVRDVLVKDIKHGKISVVIWSISHMGLLFYMTWFNIVGLRLWEY